MVYCYREIRYFFKFRALQLAVRIPASCQIMYIQHSKNPRNGARDPGNKKKVKSKKNSSCTLSGIMSIPVIKEELGPSSYIVYTYCTFLKLYTDYCTSTSFSSFLYINATSNLFSI